VNEGLLANATSFTQLPLLFDSAGEAEITLNYLDAGRIEVNAFANLPLDLGLSTASLAGNSNSFVVKPAGLCVAPSLSTGSCSTADANCSAFVPAGDPFALEVSAKRYNASGDLCSMPDTPNFKLNNILLSHSVLAPTAGSAGNLGVSSVSIANAGSVTESAQTISEVGVFAITATPPSYLGETIPATSSAPIGRFYPAYYGLDSAATNIEDVCQSNTAFTYMGQDFPVSYRVQALNRAGSITRNYESDFVTLDATQGAISAGALGDSTDLTSRLVGESGALRDSTVYSWAGGEGDLITRLQLARGSSPDGVYDAMALGIAITDADGSQFNPSALNLDVDGDGSNDYLTLGQSNQRFGRLVVDNSYGPETSVLTQRIRMEYYDGERFVLNTDDGDGGTTAGCSLLNASQLRLTVIDDDNNPDDSATLLNGALSVISIDSGVTDAQLSNTAFDKGVLALVFGKGSNGVLGAGNTGQVATQVFPDAYQQFDWDGDGSYDNVPQGRVTFGNYRGSDNIIYWLEQ
jgi:MSHA biogenesis protein MshQ